MRSKRGMEISLNVIIIAVILFIVMIVLIALFTGKIGQIRKSINTTQSQYGETKCKIPGTDRTCVLSEDGCREKGGFVYAAPGNGKWDDCMFGQICCSI